MVTAKQVDGAEQNWVLNTIETQRTRYREMVTITKHIRKVRALRIQTRTPKTFQKLVGNGVRSPLPFALVQTINGMIAKGTPQFERIPLEDTPEERKNAQALAATCWPLIQSYGNAIHQDIFYKLVDQLAGDGFGGWKMRRMTDPTAPIRGPKEDISDYQRRLNDWSANPRSKNLLQISQVDSATFWPDLADEPTYVVEAGYKMLIPTLQSLNLIVDAHGRYIPAGDQEAMPIGPRFHEEMQPSGAGNSVPVYELWTDEAAYFNINGQVIKFENELGFIPYAWRNGMTTSIPDPALQRVSTVFPFYALDPYINTLLTGTLSWAIMASMPVATLEQQPLPGTSIPDELPNFDLPLGQGMRLRPGQKLDFKVPPPMGSDAVNAINMMLGFYDRAGVTSAARGVIGTRTPGLTFSSALEVASDMFGPILDGAQGLLEDIIIMTWKAQSKLGLTLNVTGRSIPDGKQDPQFTRHKITPEMIGNYYDIHCKLQAFNDQQLQARGYFGAFMRDKGLWSEDRAMRYAGVENTEVERQFIQYDKIVNSPQVQQMITAGALSQDPAIAQTAEAAAMLAGGGLPEGAQPGGEPGGEPGGQIRGLPAPTAGGRVSGAARQPTGPGNGGPPAS